MLSRYIHVFFDFRIFESPTNQTLGGVEGVGGIGDGLTFGRHADQPLAVLGKGDDRRRRSGTLGIFNDLCLFALHDGHAGIGGAEIDADDSAFNTLGSAIEY